MLSSAPSCQGVANYGREAIKSRMKVSDIIMRKGGIYIRGALARASIFRLSALLLLRFLRTIAEAERPFGYIKSRMN